MNPVGQTIVVQAGCDHLPTTCKNKFNNLANFNGFPFVPLEDPHEGID